jgi:hypothetical protein
MAPMPSDSEKNAWLAAAASVSSDSSSSKLGDR